MSSCGQNLSLDDVVADATHVTQVLSQAGFARLAEVPPAAQTRHGSAVISGPPSGKMITLQNPAPRRSSGYTKARRFRTETEPGSRRQAHARFPSPQRRPRLRRMTSRRFCRSRRAARAWSIVTGVNLMAVCGCICPI